MRGIAFFLVSVYSHQATHSLACCQICLLKTCFFPVIILLKASGAPLALEKSPNSWNPKVSLSSPTFCLSPYLPLHPTQCSLPSGQRPPCPRSSPSESQGGLCPLPLLHYSALRAGISFLPVQSTFPSSAQVLPSPAHLCHCFGSGVAHRSSYLWVSAVEHSPRARVCSQGKSAMISCGSCRGHRGESDRMCVTSFLPRSRTFLLDMWCPAAQPLATRAYLSVN